MSFDAPPPPPTSPPNPAWPAPQPPTAPRRVDGFSLAAFISSLACCVGPLSIALGITGLVRTRGGRRSGRWAAITGVVIGTITTLLMAGAVGVAITTFANALDPSEARPGQCVNISWLGIPSDASCDGPHDGEIVWASRMNDSLMKEWESPDSLDDFCLNRDLDERYEQAYERPDILFDYWSSDLEGDPQEGDWLVCFITADNRDLDRSIADLLATGSAV